MYNTPPPPHPSDGEDFHEPTSVINVDRCLRKTDITTGKAQEIGSYSLRIQRSPFLIFMSNRIKDQPQARSARLRICKKSKDVNFMRHLSHGIYCNSYRLSTWHKQYLHMTCMNVYWDWLSIKKEHWYCQHHPRTKQGSPTEIKNSNNIWGREIETGSCIKGAHPVY